jgi:preprotein translocase subunit YajC
MMHSLFMHSLDGIAWAQGTGAGGGGSTTSVILTQLPLIALLVVVFYFLLWKPEKDRRKKMKTMLDALKKGDKVVTSSGIWGSVTNMGKETVTIQVSDNTKLKIQRDHIARVRTEDEE